MAFHEHDPAWTGKHTPTKESRQRCLELVGFGLRKELIATLMDRTVGQLDTHYLQELRSGMQVLNENVARALYYNAVHKNNVSAQIFWLKTRARWAYVNGTGGGQPGEGAAQQPLRVNVVYVTPRFAREEELQALATKPDPDEREP